MPHAVPAVPVPAGLLPQFTVVALLNVTVVNNRPVGTVSGYRPGHAMAEVPTDHGQVLRLRFTAANEHTAADAAFVVGNRQAKDDLGQAWPREVRAVSVGDVMRVEGEDGRRTHLAVAPVGFEEIDPPGNLVPIQGTDATGGPVRTEPPF